MSIQNGREKIPRMRQEYIGREPESSKEEKKEDSTEFFSNAVEESWVLFIGWFLSAFS